MKIGQLEIDLKELTNFIVKAKKNTYAGGKEKRRETDGSKTFTFQEGNFYYTDNYAGSYQAPGNEIIRWQREDGQRIWQMSYSGGMLPKFWGNEKVSHSTFEFLKNALRQIDPESPFRGPGKYENVNFIYEAWAEGDLQRFSGKEHIYSIIYKTGDDPSSRRLEMVFSQDFIGGLVIPK